MKMFYKHYFSKQFNVPEEAVDVQFFIVKRKLWDKSEFPQSRIQIFTPPSGKISVKNAIGSLEKFIDECFDTTGIKEKEHSPNPSKYACTYCPFRDRKDLCKDGIPS